MAEDGNTFWGHVSKLIRGFKVVLFTFIIATFVMLLLPGNTDFLATTNNYTPLVSVFLRNVRNMVLPPDVKLIALQISDPITLYVVAAVMFGIAITMPVFAYETYRFVDPALHEHEKRAIFPFVSTVSILFASGALFGFFFLFPAFITSMFPFFSAVGAEMIFPLMDFYKMLFFTIVISGLLFTIPAFFVLLVKFRVMKTKMLSGKRKYIYAGLVIAALLISPGASPQGDLYLFVALALLFEISMLIARRFEGTPLPKPNSLLPVPMCAFCSTKIDNANSTFCPQCNRSFR